MNIAVSNLTSNMYISNGRHYLVLFLFWPLLAFFTAIINYSQQEAKKVVYIFLIYYGFTFYIPSQFADSYRIALELQEYALLPFKEFFKMVGGLYSDTTVDVIQPLLVFIVSRFTNYPGVLFAAFAALFGFFYLKSINLLYSRYKKNPDMNGLIFIIFFVFILPITQINGFRMWTAAWIFIYGSYYVVLYGDKRYLIVALAASLVHFSFIIANTVLLIYFFLGNRNIVYIPVVILSFIIPDLIAPYVQSIGGSLSGALASRYTGYTNEAVLIVNEERMQYAAWFMRLRVDLILYYLIFAIIYIQIKSGKLMQDKPERNMFSFLLLFLSFVNFGGVIPTVGNRFQIVFFLFATFYIIIYILKLPDKKISLLTWIGLFPMLLFAAVSFRQGADTINAWIFSPGFGLPLLAPGLSLSELLF
jgi:hypothetical protein